MDAILRTWIFVGCVTLCWIIQVTVSEKTVCSDYLVSGLDGVDDSKLTASSIFMNDIHGHGPQNARLHFAAGPNIASSAWVAGANDVHQYIQVQFPRETQIETILLQGRKATTMNQFVRTYYISYSIDGVTWTTVTSENHEPTLFTGNSDTNTVVKSRLVPSISAMYIRINPRNWNEYVSLRFDVSGCYKEEEKKSRSEFYKKIPMLPSGDVAQYPVLKVQSRSLLDCSKLCHQDDTCHAFTFDKNQKICRDITAASINQYSANSEPGYVYVNKGIFTLLGFRQIPNGHTLYKVNEHSMDQVSAADLCTQHYSRLIRITMESEMLSLQNVIAGNTILLQDHNQLFVSGIYVSPDWTYSDGAEAIDSALWSEGHPDTTQGHCVMITQTGLASVSCAEHLFSICG